MVSILKLFLRRYVRGAALVGIKDGSLTAENRNDWANIVYNTAQRVRVSHPPPVGPGSTWTLPEMTGMH